jgi:hypothetical protein
MKKDYDLTKMYLKMVVVCYILAISFVAGLIGVALYLLTQN